MRAAARLLIAAISGLALAAAFPPVGWSWLILFGAFGLIGACWKATWPVAVGVGAVGGAVFFGLLVSWMTIVGLDAWFGVVLYLTFWFVLAAIGTSITSRLTFAPLWVTCVWVGEEVLRGQIPFGGFPWGRFAFATAGVGLEYAAAIGGAALVTGMVILLASSAVWAIEQAQRRTAVFAGLFLAIVVAVSALGFFLPGPSAARSQRVAVVQGSVPEYGMGAMDTRRRVFENHLQQTLRLSRETDVQVVIWPENAADIDPTTDQRTADELTVAARAIDAPILVGAVIVDPNDPAYRLNVGIVWGPNGPGQIYAKTHPVPFGEYIPFRSQLAGYTDRFDRIPSDFAAGTRPGNLDLAGVNVGDVICFEIAYDAVVRAVVTQGAQYLAVQTNNATYGATAQPAQQLAITRLAAIEHGRWIAVAATSGVSAFVDTKGNVRQQLTDNTAGSLVQDVPLLTGLTLADRVAPFLGWIITIIGVTAVIVGLIRRRRTPDLG